MRQIKYIVLHCTASPQTQTVAQIQRFWRNKGWRRPGYHRLVDANGVVHKLAEYSEITNGVAGHNSNSIHLSYIGGVDASGRPIDNRTQSQRKALEELVLEASRLFPDAIIQGHRDFSPDRNRNGIIEPNEWMKACPSFSVKTWLDEIGYKSQSSLPLLSTTTNVNIRTGAGTNFPLASTPINKGTQVKKIGEDSGWTFVLVPQNNIKGWIASRFLA